MQLKNKNVYFLRHAAKPAGGDQRPQANDDCEPVVFRLSRRAKKNLQLLQLKFLDRKGREPDPSQVIEKLINEAAGSELEVPYPVG